VSSDSSLSARERLLQAAEQVVVRDGWRAATSRAIAAQAELNPGLVNYYFGSKDDLLLEALQRAFERFEAPLVETLAEAGLAETLAAMATMVDAEPSSPEARMLFEASLQAVVDERLRELSVAKLREFRSMLATKLRAEGRDAATAGAWATLVAAALDGLLLHRMIDANTDTAGAIRALVDASRPR
jgi:AcrR family transcriptional regulator